MSADARLLPSPIIINWCAKELGETILAKHYGQITEQALATRRKFLSQSLYRHKIARTQLQSHGYITNL